MWKPSTQRFKLRLFSETAVRRQKLLKGRWKPSLGAHFFVRERGYCREIHASPIRDRQVHKTLTHEFLIPAFKPSMIYNNGASQKGKGLHFHFRLLAEQLRRYYRLHGRDGGVLLMDYSKFFPSVPHRTLYDRHERYLLDPPLRVLADDIIAFVPGGKGMYMGVELSQIEMVSLPSPIDNWAQCQMQADIAHYMDDYELVADMKTLKRVKEGFIQRSLDMGLKINPKKCQIVPLTKPFKFCKAKFYLTETGKVVIHGNRDSLSRARRKLRKFKTMVATGQISPDVPAQFVIAMHGYYSNYSDHGRCLMIDRMYHSLFVEPAQAAA